MNKVPEYRGMADEQLEMTLTEVIKNLFHLRFQSATDRLETPSEINKAKREIARIKTIQRERALAKERAEAEKVAAEKKAAWDKATAERIAANKAKREKARAEIKAEIQKRKTAKSKGK